MTADEWAEASDANGLRAQLRGSREALTEALDTIQMHCRDNAMLLRMLASERRERDFWRDQCRKRDMENARLQQQLNAWKRWEHDWIFGGDAPWPGNPGTADPRDALDDLERLALGLPGDADDDTCRTG